jgi:transcriptional regulator with AAA-type ATPase domain
LKVASYTGRHVLLDGESGTGKEIAARILHHYYRSRGRTGPFVVQNGASFANEEDAVASLFGVARGGFTGVSQRSGAIESADLGTLFIDEVHNLPLRVQRSLLRFLENGEIQRVGGSVRSHVDVCLIFGTNHPVPDALEEGLLARDLITRLHRVSLPPLRQRRADIPEIFLEVLYHSGAPEIARMIEDAFDEEMMERLVCGRYHRGNIRELEDLASLLVAEVLEGEQPWVALAQALSRAGAPSRLVERARSPEGNITKLEMWLKERGVSCSRRWLATHLERWDVQPVTRR